MVLNVQNVTKSFPGADGPVAVLRGIDLQMAAGETLALTGESGSGKSTLLHLVGGLDAVDGGVIEVDGQDLSDMDDSARAALRRTSVSVIFQQFNLIPSLTVAANISFQARLSGALDVERVAHLTDALGLTPHLNKYPESLPGGCQHSIFCSFSSLHRGRCSTDQSALSGHLNRRPILSCIDQRLRCQKLQFVLHLLGIQVIFGLTVHGDNAQYC